MSTCPHCLAKLLTLYTSTGTGWPTVVTYQCGTRQTQGEAVRGPKCGGAK